MAENTQKHFQFLRSAEVKTDLAAAKTALSGLTLMAGEPAIALYKDKKQAVKALFAIAPQTGTGKTLFLGEDEVKALITTAKSEAIADANGKIGDLKLLATTTKGNLVAAINEVHDAIASAETAGKVTMVETAGNGNVLKSYTFYQGEKTEANKIGTINLAKDLVVTSGEVVTNPKGQSAGTYIKLVIANQTEPIYIDVKKLVDVYTAKENAAQVQVAISDTNEVSATIVAKSVTNTELSDNVNTSLGRADSAIQSVSTGTANGTISVDGVNVAVHGLGSAAYTNSNAYDASGSAATVKSEVIGTSGDAKTADTIYGAKAYADAAVAAKDVSATGDTYVQATAENNKVTVAATDKLTGAVAKAESALQSVAGTAQQITVTTKTNGSQTISFAADAVFDCGTF